MTSSKTLSDGSLRYAVVTDVGMRRAVNQDAYAVQPAENGQWPQSGHLFVVADGMGAHAAGELASQQAVQELTERYADADGEEGLVLRNAMREANLAIHQRGQEDPQLFNMGTTCSALTIKREGAFVGHVGDSRVYRYRDAQIEQLTFDHSLFWEMREARQFSKEEERESAVPRNVITRCLGPHAEVQVDIEGPFSVAAGDKFLLCSDGLTGRISDEELGAVLGEMEAEPGANFLVDLANLRGGSDNITVLIVEVLGNSLKSKGPNVDRAAKQRQDGQSTHPAWWLTIGIGILLSALALGADQWGLAALALSAAAVAALGACYQRWQASPKTTSPIRQPPYAKAHAAFDQTIVVSVAETMTEVVEAISLPTHEYTAYREQIQALVDSHVDFPRQIGERSATLTQEILTSLRRAIQSARSISPGDATPEL